MITPQLILDLNHELIVDNFAGGGGASTGIEWALGRHVDHAINHDLHALGMHRINHPQTVHHCEDVFDIDPATLCEGRPVGLAHFSPDCKHFSKAKGGKPLDKRIRGLALIMFRWAKYGARVMTMENVEEIRTWGPLKWMCKKGKWGWHPDPDHIGRTWLMFLDILSTGCRPDHPDLPDILEVLGGTVTREECVRGFGYQYEARCIRACVHGSPTIRNRLYMIARRDGRPIVWPAATHTSPRTPGLGLKPYRVIADCIEWDRPCPSIFLTKKQAKRRGINCKRPLAKASLRRIAMGVDRFVLKAKEPFLVNLTHQGTEARGESTREPARTITGANRGEKALVAPSLSKFHGSHGKRGDGAARNYSVQECLGTADTSNRYGLSEATLAPIITECANASNQRNMPADEPGRTICGEVKGGHFAVVSANLAVNTSGHPGAAVDAPAPTIPTGGHHALVAGTLVQTGYGERDGQAPRALDPEKPAGTIVAGGGKIAAVTGTLIHTAHGEADKNGRRRGRGAHDVQESMPAVLGSPDCAIAMLKLRGQPGSHPSAPADEPAPTICAGTHRPETHGGAASTHGAVAAYLAQHNGGFNETPGHAATEPVSALSSKGSQQQVVAAHVSAYYGQDAMPGQGVGTPARTSTEKDRLSIVESFIACTMTPEQVAGARRVARFLRSFGVEFEGEFATIEGFVLVDIGMRMLTPRELFRAQGFGENYIIDRAWVVDPKTGDVREVLLTKEQQIRMCGNSVCPQVAAALVRANVPELAVRSRQRLRALVESEVRA